MLSEAEFSKNLKGYETPHSQMQSLSLGAPQRFAASRSLVPLQLFFIGNRLLATASS
jgi:hypothetical protein